MQNFLGLLTAICCELGFILLRGEYEGKKIGNSVCHQICLIHVIVLWCGNPGHASGCAGGLEPLPRASETLAQSHRHLCL